MQLKDLGLSYEEALHGVQSAIRYRMENGGRSHEPKHMRVGIDMGKADMCGLATLLIAKGVFTPEEYVEHLRIAANQELHMHEEEIRALTGNPAISFR